MARTGRTVPALLVLGFALALVPGVRADDPYGPDGRKYGPVDTGTVASVNVEERWFTIVNGVFSKTFDVEDVTVIQIGDDPIALGDLELGDEVTVSARHERPGRDRPVADRVQVVRKAEPAGKQDAPPEGG